MSPTASHTIVNGQLAEQTARRGVRIALAGTLALMAVLAFAVVTRAVWPPRQAEAMSSSGVQ